MVEALATSKQAFAALALPDFRRLLLSRVTSTIATQVQSVIIGWQIYGLTHNPLSLGLIGLAEAFPAIGVALYAGHVADVVDRKKIYLASMCVLTLSVGALSWLSYSHLSNDFTLACLYLLVALTGLARGFLAPATFGLVSDIVPRELYGNASAWNTTLWQISAVAGPLMAGYLYVAVGAPATYAASAALLGTSLVLGAFLESRGTPAPSKHASVVDSIKEGLHFVFSNQIVLGAMTLDLFAVLFGGAVALLPIFAAEIFHRGPEALGLLRAAPAIGSLVMAVLLAFRPITQKAGKILLAAVSGFGICMICFGLSKSFLFSIIVLALSGAFDTVSVFVRSTTFQIVTPNEMKGRVAAVNSIFIGSSNEIGEFESGVMAKMMGTVPSVVFGGFMTLGVVIATSLRAPKLRDLDL